MRREVFRAMTALAAVGAVTSAYTRWLNITNTTTVALSFLLIVLVVAATCRLWVALLTSVAAMLCANYFFLPPLKTFAVADPQNWVALAAFLTISLVASHLSSVARTRTNEAVARRDEVARLFDLSRDIFLLTEGDETIAPLTSLIARRFAMDFVAICLPQGENDWRIAKGGSMMLTLDPGRLSAVMAEPDSHGSMDAGGHLVQLVPLRFGTGVVGLLAAAGRPIERGTLDALGGVAAIAMERAQFLAERKATELSRRSEELKSTLLASLAHDLRTPLTAIRVAATNLQAPWPDDEARREQSALVLTEVGRLTRLFENVLEMARIDAGAIGADLRWVHPSEIVAAARDQVGDTMAGHELRAEAESDRLVRVDPRLTATALAHVLENAAQYAPPGSAVEVTAAATDSGLVVCVSDRGPGIAAQDLPHIFERFYRGTEAKSHVSGTGMGLSIAKGMLAAERGRISVEQRSDGGAQFTVVVPAETRAVSAADMEQPV
jgi:two-component system, OmpR family, sensor histidine kinase KdpD